MIKFFFQHKPFLSLLYSLFLASFIFTYISFVEIKTPFSFSGVHSHPGLDDIYTFAPIFPSRSVITALFPSEEDQEGLCVDLRLVEDASQEAHAPNTFMSGQMCDNNFLKEADRVWVHC